MSTPNSRTTLKAYCLRRLGSPVVEINVYDDQVDDRLQMINYNASPYKKNNPKSQQQAGKKKANKKAKKKMIKQ